MSIAQQQVKCMSKEKQKKTKKPKPKMMMHGSVATSFNPSLSGLHSFLSEPIRCLSGLEASIVTV